MSTDIYTTDKAAILSKWIKDIYPGDDEEGRFSFLRKRARDLRYQGRDKEALIYSKLLYEMEDALSVAKKHQELLRVEDYYYKYWIRQKKYKHKFREESIVTVMTEESQFRTNPDYVKLFQQYRARVEEHCFLAYLTDSGQYGAGQGYAVTPKEFKEQGRCYRIINVGRKGYDIKDRDRVDEELATFHQIPFWMLRPHDGMQVLQGSRRRTRKIVIDRRLIRYNRSGSTATPELE